MKWVPHNEIDWLDSRYNQFNIDTRDFHVIGGVGEQHKDWETIKKYPRFFLHHRKLKNWSIVYMLKVAEKVSGDA